MTRSRIHAATLGLSLIVFSGCGGGTEPVVPQLATISVSSAANKTSIALGETVQLTASGQDKDGDAIAVGTVSWSSNNAAVATVDGNGLVTGTGGGAAVITATSAGVSGTFNLTVAGSIHSSNVTTSQTWRAADNPHFVTAAISVAGSASPTLTIEAGAILRFASGAGLTIGGTNVGALKANGTAAAPIEMRADATTPAKGFWKGISIESNAGPSELRYVTARHCGGGNTTFPACIFLDGASVKPILANVTLENSAGHGVVARNSAGFGAGSTVLTVTNANLYPVHIAPNEAGGIPSGGTFTGNTNNAVFLSNSRVTTTQTWPALGIPYVASVDVIVEATGTPILTLSPGTEIRLDAGRYFTIGTCGAGGPGVLVAVGTAAQPIKFTANAASPAAGHWAGLTISCTATAATRIENVIVEYGGGTSNYAAFAGNILVELDLGPIVKNTISRFSKDCGIIRRSPLVTWSTDFTASQHGNTFTNNTRIQCGP